MHNTLIHNQNTKICIICDFIKYSHSFMSLFCIICALCNTLLIIYQTIFTIKRADKTYSQSSLRAHIETKKGLVHHKGKYQTYMLAYRFYLRMEDHLDLVQASLELLVAPQAVALAAASSAVAEDNHPAAELRPQHDDQGASSRQRQSL